MSGNKIRHFKRNHKKLYKKVSALSSRIRKHINRDSDKQSKVGIDPLDASDADQELQEANTDDKLNEMFDINSSALTGKKRSWVWNLVDHVKDRYYACKLCNQKMSMSHGSTGNVMRHFRNRHSKEYSILQRNMPKKDNVRGKEVLSESFIKVYFTDVNANEYKCNYCEDTFVKSEENEHVLFNHIREKHTEEVEGLEGVECSDLDDDFSLVVVRKKDLVL